MISNQEQSFLNLMNNDPRDNALQVLNALDDKKTTLDHLMDDMHERFSIAEKRDRALLQTLVYGVLRWRGRIDWIIKQFSKTKLNKIDPNILNILRLGIFQIAFLDRIPPSAAVNTSVELSKSYGGRWVVGFVNGLLRNFARNSGNISFPDKLKSPEEALSVEKSFPLWLIRRWASRWGMKETDALCDAINKIPPITVRVNTLKVNRNRLLQDLKEQVENIEASPFSPEGLSFSHPKMPLHQIDSFSRGEFSVQDEAAQLVSHLLSPKTGESILDACAGLGGKTGHLAQLMNNQGHIMAMDKDSSKLSLLEQEMERIGVSIVSTKIHALGDSQKDFPVSNFNRILLDAPCSGTGVMRRNPDIKWFFNANEVHRLSRQQLMLLECVAPLLASNGTLLFVVCSTEPEENEIVIKKFLSRHLDLKILPVESSNVIPASCITKDGFFRSLPHLHSMDGFFAARLYRPAS
jgi:16S rRNA (cytosine967-C5)-methyltransferase